MIHGMAWKARPALIAIRTGEYPEDDHKRTMHQVHKDLDKKNVNVRVEVFDCHHPHGKIKPSSQDCLKSCHGNEAKVGQHNLHMTRQGCSVLTVTSHTWTVGKEQARPSA